MTGTSGTFFTIRPVTCSAAVTTTTGAVSANAIYSNSITYATGISTSQCVGLNEFSGLMTDGTYFRFASIYLAPSACLWTVLATIAPMTAMTSNTTYTTAANTLKINVYT